jgi:hypothetical protein
MTDPMMPAFEITKKLWQDGFATPFLAVFDQPTHIKERMRHGGWADVLLTLARFFDLLPSAEAEATVVAQRAVGGGLEDDTDKGSWWICSWHRPRSTPWRSSAWTRAGWRRGLAWR